MVWFCSLIRNLVRKMLPSFLLHPDAFRHRRQVQHCFRRRRPIGPHQHGGCTGRVPLRGHSEARCTSLPHGARHGLGRTRPDQWAFAHLFRGRLCGRECLGAQPRFRHPQPVAWTGPFHSGAPKTGEPQQQNQRHHRQARATTGVGNQHRQPQSSAHPHRHRRSTPALQ